MKIVQFNAENVKMLRVVEITPAPDGHMVVIGGDNANGKSSVLDAIAMVLGGGEQIPAQPIRHGASKAQITIRTEEWVATRTFSAKGSQLKIESTRGVPFSSPQAMMDELTNRVSFDPLAFTRMDAKKQAETLQRLVGLDLSALKDDYEQTFRDLKQQQARLEGMKKHPFTPKAPVDAAEIVARLTAAQEQNAKNASAKERIALAVAATEAANSRHAKLAAELEKARDEWNEAFNAMEKLKEEVAEIEDIDPAPIAEELKSVETTNQHVRENAAFAKEQAAVAALTTKADTLTARLEAIQVWIERVGHGEECTVIMEDGEARPA